MRKDAWLNTFNNYQESQKGNEKRTILTQEEVMGRRKLEVKVRKGKIHIGPADEGKGVVAMTLNMYEEMVRKHTEKDKKELEEV